MREGCDAEDDVSVWMCASLTVVLLVNSKGGRRCLYGRAG